VLHWSPSSRLRLGLKEALIAIATAGVVCVVGSAAAHAGRADAGHIYWTNSRNGTPEFRS